MLRYLIDNNNNNLKLMYQMELIKDVSVEESSSNINNKQSDNKESENGEVKENEKVEIVNNDNVLIKNSPKQLVINQEVEQAEEGEEEQDEEYDDENKTKSPKSSDTSSLVFLNQSSDTTNSNIELTVSHQTPQTSSKSIIQQQPSQQKQQQPHQSHIETVLRQYRFKIPISDYYMMLEDAVVEEKSSKQYRYLTGDFMRIFEKHLEQFEKCKVQIQKRNNIVYDVPSRTSTVYIRINGDCKLCPRSSRVKFVFTIRKKPKGNEKFIDIDTKSRGNHVHNGITIISSDDLPLENSKLNPLFSFTKSSSNQNQNNNNNSNNNKKRKNQNANQETLVTKNNNNLISNFDENNICSNININNNNNNNNDDINNFLNTSSASLSNLTDHSLQTIITSTPPPNIPPHHPLSQHSLHHQPTFPSSLRFGSSSNNPNTPNMTFPNLFSATAAASSILNDRLLLSQLANQITSRIMIKLDQINLKVNQISDRLYELERKFDSAAAFDGVNLPNSNTNEFQHHF